MRFNYTIIEYEGVLVNVRKRYWSAHLAALESFGYRGPEADEFWRLVRTGASDGMMVPYAKSREVPAYTQVRDERLQSTELMMLDESSEEIVPSLRVLKECSTCHLVTFNRNREAVNAVLDRDELWPYFDRKEVLPRDSDRRVELLRELSGPSGALAIAGTVQFTYTASEAGCRVVALKSGVAFPKQFRQAGADAIFDDLDEFTDALGERDEELQRIGIL